MVQQGPARNQNLRCNNYCLVWYRKTSTRRTANFSSIPLRSSECISPSVIGHRVAPCCGNSCVQGLTGCRLVDGCVFAAALAAVVYTSTPTWPNASWLDGDRNPSVSEWAIEHAASIALRACNDRYASPGRCYEIKWPPLIFDPGSFYFDIFWPRSFCFEIEWLPEIEWPLHHASVKKQTS